MDGGLITEISKDLNILQFLDEDEKSYKCRLIYSCIACWIKTATLDTNPFSEEPIGVSKAHVLNKTKIILNEMLVRIPDVVEYFNDERMEPIIEIRERLLKIGELDQVGFKTNIILHKRESIPLTPYIRREKGSLFGNNLLSVGLSQIQFVDKYMQNIIENQETVDTSAEWFNRYVQNALWRKIDRIDDKYQYFNPYTRVGSNYECWQDSFPKEIYGGIVLLRSDMSKTEYEYFLLRKENGLAINKIDPLLVSFGEVKRMMFILRKKANNPVRVYVKTNIDSVRILLGAVLPNREENILYSYAWPNNRFSNRVNWTMIPEMWNYVAPKLAGLGMEIMEDNCDG